MPQNFLSADRDQGMLLAPDIRDWLPAGHLAWFVIETVEGLDLDQIYAGYRSDGHGRAAHEPRMMTTLLLYAYATNTRSSRAIERACETDIAFRVISANRQPDHATLARFQSRHQELLAGLFGQVLGLCARADLTGGEALAVDSTKLSANASGTANRSYEQIARETVEQAIATDAAEDEAFGESRGDEILPELRTVGERKAWVRRNLEEMKREREAEKLPCKRSERLAECKARLEAEHEIESTAERGYRETRANREAELPEGKKLTGRAPTGKPATAELAARKINITDPDSAIVKGPRGFKQGYSAQAVCTEGQVIVAAELIATSPDANQLEPMITAAHENMAAAGEQVPPRVLADAGYWSNAQIESLQRQGLEVLLPPDGALSRGPQPARRSALAERQRERLREPEAAERYRARQVMIEPIFGQTKHNRGFERLSRRGIVACRSEWSLICLTHNLLKLFRARPALSLA